MSNSLIASRIIVLAGAFFSYVSLSNQAISQVISDTETANILVQTDPLDFFIQDVCLDVNAKAIMNASPLSKNCVSKRDLRPGENLPYHKIKYLGKDEIKSLRDMKKQVIDAFISADNHTGKETLRGITLEETSSRTDTISTRNPATTNKKGFEKIWNQITRYDSIPFEFPGLRASPESKKVIGAVFVSDKSTIGTYESGPDTIHGPDIVSQNTVWRAFAMDHSAPYKNISKKGCTPGKDTSDVKAALDGNISVELVNGRFSGALSGDKEQSPTQYISSIVGCPSFGDEGAIIHWKFRWVSHPIALPVGDSKTPVMSPQPLLTLQVVNAKDVNATHTEPEFYTREFGLTRHESWNNIKAKVINSEGDKVAAWSDEVIRQHKDDAIKIVDQGHCNNPAPIPPFEGLTQTTKRTKSWVTSDGSAEWVLVSCRQTSIAIPSNDQTLGDSTRTWRNALATMELSAPLLGVDPTTPPVIKSISHEEAIVGTKITLLGSEFKRTDNTVIFGKRSCSLTKLESSRTSKENIRKIEFIIPEICASNEMAGKDYEISVYNGSATSTFKNPILGVNAKALVVPQE